MACPHYSRDDNDCTLLHEAPRDDEEGTASPPDEPVARDWCLARDKGFRNCPIFQRYLSDLLPRPPAV